MRKITDFYRIVVVVLFAVLPLCLMGRSVRGDLNRDGCYDVSDVTKLITYALNQDWPTGDLPACDLNYDKMVDVTDVTYLIRMVLNGEVPPPPEMTIPEGSVTYTVGGVSFQMVPVEGGTFTMGGYSQNTTPRHEVTVSGFSIGLTEVTVGLWKAVMGSFHREMLDDDQPAGGVNWDECQEFISKLNEMTGLNFKLPTEAQWEFAARGGNLSQSYTFAGSNDLDEVAWYQATMPMPGGGYYFVPCVGTKMPNELGLYDMCGSVREHCQDSWRSNYETDEPQMDPLYENPLGNSYVARGGCCSSLQADCAVYSRWQLDHDSGPSVDVGLRLAM